MAYIKGEREQAKLFPASLEEYVGSTTRCGSLRCVCGFSWILKIWDQF